jgi:hypothetical protein
MKNMNGMLYGALAGMEIDGSAQAQNNRIAIFIDSKAGGYNALSTWTNRTGVPNYEDGIRNLNNAIVFDAGFSPDYILAINCANGAGQTYYDLYDMSANTNLYLGASPNPAQFGYLPNAIEGDLTKGFEFAFPLSLIGSPTTSLKLFAFMVNDPNTADVSYVANQFLTHAAAGQANYGQAAIDFNNEPANPLAFLLSADCYEQVCTGVTPTTTTTVPPLGPLCYNTSATLPNPSVSGTWNPPLIANTTVGLTTYTFTPAAGACATSASLNIEILPQIITTLIFHN